MKHMNVRTILLLVLSLAMIALTTSCGLKTWLDEKAPWVDQNDDSDSIEDGKDDESSDKDDGKGTSATTKPAEPPVPEVEYKDEMSDDDFIKGSWGDTSEK